MPISNTLGLSIFRRQTEQFQAVKNRLAKMVIISCLSWNFAVTCPLKVPFSTRTLRLNEHASLQRADMNTFYLIIYCSLLHASFVPNIQK